MRFISAAVVDATPEHGLELSITAGTDVPGE
jgi:hypothetical protein